MRLRIVLWPLDNVVELLGALLKFPKLPSTRGRLPLGLNILPVACRAGGGRQSHRSAPACRESRSKKGGHSSKSEGPGSQQCSWKVRPRSTSFSGRPVSQACSGRAMDARLARSGSGIVPDEPPGLTGRQKRAPAPAVSHSSLASSSPWAVIRVKAGNPASNACVGSRDPPWCPRRPMTAANGSWTALGL